MPEAQAASPRSRAALSFMMPGITSGLSAVCSASRDPPVRGQQREVRAEQHAALQVRVRGTHERLGEVLRAPPGQVDPGVVLVGRDRERLVLPGHRGVGHDDLQIGEVRRDGIEQDRVRAARAAGRSRRAAPRRSRSGRCGTVRPRRLLDRGVQRVVPLVARVEALHGRVELEAAHPVLLDQPARGIDRGGALQRVDRAERDQHVVVARGALGDLGAGDRRVAEPVSASTVKTTAAILRSR